MRAYIAMTTAHQALAYLVKRANRPFLLQTLGMTTILLSAGELPKRRLGAEQTAMTRYGHPLHPIYGLLTP
jgi:hypothetical protein